MIKRIMVPTDGSDFSRKALKTALDLARKFQAEIVLLYVPHTPEAYWGYNPAFTITVTDEQKKQIKDAGDKTIKYTLKDFDLSDIVMKTKIIQGNPSNVILEEVSNEKIDLIIMGSHGYGVMAGAVLGSVSQRVLRKSTCSVLIAK